MMVLAGEIIICLIASFLIGFLTGWALRTASTRKKWKEIEKVYQINLASLKHQQKKS